MVLVRFSWNCALRCGLSGPNDRHSPMLRKRPGSAPVKLSSVVTLAFSGERPLRGGIPDLTLRAEVGTFNPGAAIDAPSRDVARRIHTGPIKRDPSGRKAGLAVTLPRSPALLADSTFRAAREFLRKHGTRAK